MSSKPSSLGTNIHKADSVLAIWTFAAEDHREAIVIPDGCRDLIIEHRSDSDSRCFVSELSRHTYSVCLSAGTHMTGLRLKPGTSVDDQALLDWARTSYQKDILESDQLDEFCERQFAVAEALECLQSGVNSVAQAAQHLGVSPRTLQRTVKRFTGETPFFWFALARVRRTCRYLSEFGRLADAAAAFGYADQAHMTREVKAWLGVTPSAIKPSSEVVAQVDENGYG